LGCDSGFPPICYKQEMLLLLLLVVVVYEI
jgi:hypothetical protein